MKRMLLLTIVCSFVVAFVWCVFGQPTKSPAKPPKDRVYWDANFRSAPLYHFSPTCPLVLSPDTNFKATATDGYRTTFGTGNVVVELVADDEIPGTIDATCDVMPFLIRVDDGDLSFSAGIQGGHRIKDNLSTPRGGIGEGGNVIPFPTTEPIVYDDDLDADYAPGTLQVVAGDVDLTTYEMLPAEEDRPQAHVILHIYVNDIPLFRHQGKDASELPVGKISIAKIEFRP